MRRLLALVALAGCSTSPTIDPYRVEPVDLVVSRGDLEDHVVLTGQLDAADSVELKVPRTRSWQLSIRWMVDQGARVKKGDRLLEFDNSELTQQLRELELAIVRADNDLASQRARDQVAVADKELEVERQRVEVAKAELDANLPKNLVPQREWRENQLKLSRAKTAHATAVDDLEAARRAAALELEVKQLEVTKAERNYERATQQLDALVLRAPRDGVAVIADHPWFGRKLQVGDMVRPGFSGAKVSDLSTMNVIAQLSDVDDGRVAVGMVADCVLDAYPERHFPGRVAAISEIAVEASEKSTRRFFKVTIALEKTDTEVMRPGMSVRVDVVGRSVADVVVAPREGLLLAEPGGDQPSRALLHGGGERAIEVGFCTARACTVTSGLTAGQRLRYRAEVP